MIHCTKREKHIWSKVRTFVHLILIVAPISSQASDRLNNSKGTKDAALELKVNQWVQNSRGVNFTENKGQMADIQGKPVNDLLFKTSTPGADVYITSWGLSYVFTHIEESGLQSQKENNPDFNSKKNNAIYYCRADMELVGADIRKENIIKEYESENRTD